MSITNYLWDEESYLEEYDELGTTTASYTNEPTGLGKLISQYGETASYFHYDGEGSTHQLTDENENVTDTFLYDAWGIQLFRTGSTSTPFLYLGNYQFYYSESIESYYVESDIYQPIIGRWISPSPPKNIESSNSYIPSFVSDGVDPKKIEATPNGLWKCQSKNPTLQAQITLTEKIENCCEDGKCRLDVRAYRCFHESVQPGDDKDPKRFMTRIYARIRKYCGSKLLSTTRIHDVELYPGRLVYPGGPLGRATAEYLKTLNKCSDFSLTGLLQRVKDVDPPKEVN